MFSEGSHSVNTRSKETAKPRVVWISRRFWPLVGGAERMISYLATAWAEQGGRSIVLTARWDPHWSEEMQFQGVSIVRIPQPQVRLVGTLRYMHGLARWLRRNQAQYDCVCVSMLKHDAYAAMRAVAGQVPVILRAEGAGRTGDCYWQLEARCGRRIKYCLMRADGLIAPSRTIQQEVQAAGYDRSKIHYIPNGVPIPPLPSAVRRQEARAALAGLHPALQNLIRLEASGTETPLAVYTGRLHPAKGLAELIVAWDRIRLRWPWAQLCLVGEGPFRPELEAQIAQRNLHECVHLLGPFDSVEEFLAGADLFILPSYEEGMSLALLEAMAAGLPIVATDIPGNRDLVQDGREALLVPPANPDALTAGITRILSQPSLAAHLAQGARRRAENEFSLDQCLREHERLFQSLLDRQRQTDPPAT